MSIAGRFFSVRPVQKQTAAAVQQQKPLPLTWRKEIARSPPIIITHPSPLPPLATSSPAAAAAAVSQSPAAPPVPSSSPGLVEEGIEKRDQGPVVEVVRRICDSMVSWIESSESGCALVVGPSGCGKTFTVNLAARRLNAALKSYHPWSAETCGGFEHMIVTASKVGRIGLRAGGSGSGSGDRVRRILLVEYGDLWAMRKMAGSGGGGGGGGQGGGRKNKKYSFESALPSPGTFIVVECQNTRPACLQKLRKGGLANQWRVFEFDRESRDLRESGRDRDARGSSLAAAGSIARFRYAPLNRARLMMVGNVLDSEVLSMVEDDRNMHDIMWFNGPLTTVEREGGRSGSSVLAEERDLWSEMDAEEGTRGLAFNSSLPHDVLEAVMFRRQRGCLLSGLDRLTWPTTKHWDALKAGRRHVPPSVDKELTDLLLRGKEQRTLLDERCWGE